MLTVRRSISITWFVPAMARNKRPDAVLLLAAVALVSAINLAPAVLPASPGSTTNATWCSSTNAALASRLLQCPDDKNPAAERRPGQPTRQAERLRTCMTAFAEAAAHGDLRQYTTVIAMQDIEAVHAHLGYTWWNLVGASSGTRAALDYLRQFPTHVRRTVLDGVAPPDMVLPTSFLQDGQAALDALIKASAQQFPRNAPATRQEWQNCWSPAAHGAKCASLNRRTRRSDWTRDLLRSACAAAVQPGSGCCLAPCHP